MNNLRFDINLGVGSSETVIRSEGKSETWKIIGSLLTSSKSGARLRFHHDTKVRALRRWFCNLNKDLVVTDLGDPAGEVARLNWRDGKGGEVSFAGMETCRLERERGNDPAVTGDCLRISVINWQSRLIVPVEFTDHVESLLIIGSHILSAEWSDMNG